MMRIIDMADGKDESPEVFVDVSSDEVREWSRQINEQLESIQQEVGTAAPRYRAAFLCAYLLQRFADELETDAEEPLGAEKLH